MGPLAACASCPPGGGTTTRVGIKQQAVIYYWSGVARYTVDHGIIIILLRLKQSFSK